MAHMKLLGKDLKGYEDIDLDKLLEGLSEQELEDLNYELDPDNALLPASDRCRDQTKKSPTGKFDREALIAYLEKTSLEEPDWEQNKPFVKETRGKIFTPKAKPKSKEEEACSTEFDDVLCEATEDELVDLAAVLDFVGMMNQTQYHNALDGVSHTGEGFQSVAKATPLKEYENDPPNETDVDDSIDKVKANDGGLTELNLNNIKNISAEKFVNLFNGLRDNTNLRSLSMANTRVTDSMIKPLADALKENGSLSSLNLESNFLTGALIVQLLEAINEKKSVVEFKASNQRQTCMGVKSEMRAADLVCENDKLMRLGLDMDVRSARLRVHEHLQANTDRECRQKRVGNSESRQSSADR